MESTPVKEVSTNRFQVHICSVDHQSRDDVTAAMFSCPVQCSLQEGKECDDVMFK